MKAQNICCYEFGSFRLDPAEHLLFHEGKVVSLTPKAFDTLLVLVENHGHLVEKDELLEKVWEGSFVEEANVAKHISMLRKILSGNGLEEPFIETIPTRGYRFVAPLTETELEASQESGVKVESSHQVKDANRRKLPKSSTRRKGTTAVMFSAGIISVAAVLAAGAWYYLSFVIEGDGPTIETTEVSLSTGFEKARYGTISPDGKLIVFRRFKPGGKQTLAIRRLATGETIDLVDVQPDSGADPSFSPDSKFIYCYLHEKNSDPSEAHLHPFYRIPVSGGPAEKIIDDLPSKVAVSPDGNQLAFIRSDPSQTEATVIVSDKDGENQEAIFTVKRTNLYNQVLWSGDGQRLLIFERERYKRQSAKWINKVDKTVTEAKELKPLLGENWGWANNLILLKDGSGFLFVGAKSLGDPHQIFHLRTVDGKITPITPGRVGWISVSDDGKTMALNRWGKWYFNMISYDPVTKESRQIMNENKDISLMFGFSQMPDGKILFSNGSFGSDIYLMNKDGGNETRVTSNALANQNPVATPDGKYIVFKSRRTGSFNLWRMDADGSNPVQLTHYLQKELRNQNTSIQITNNGKTVFFAQQPDGGERSQLMKISINGGEPSQLLPNSQTSDYVPRISPDGKKLAYLGYVFDGKTSENKFTTYIHSLDGDRVGEIKKKFEGGIRPQWSADGKALTYLKQKNQIWNIWKRDIKTGKETALTSFKSKANQVGTFKWSNDGKKIFIVRGFWNQPDAVLIKNRDISKKLY